MSIYPNWLMCTGDSPGECETIITYVDGIDMEMMTEDISLSLNDHDMSCTIISEELTMEINNECN